MMSDPDGQSTFGYGPKVQILHLVHEMMNNLAKLRQTVQAQPEIISDSMRAAVLKEFADDLRKEAGALNYYASYEEMKDPRQAEIMRKTAETAQHKSEFLAKYGWGTKYNLEGFSLYEDNYHESIIIHDKTLKRIEDAFIKEGATGVIKLFKDFNFK